LKKIKYQVFISSTYSDLHKERKQVLDILLMADCIPAGMENFVATDDEQFNVIKKVIDLCDYYVLILGKRYGSVNEKTGISYTEMEYNYAIDKGIPVLVFAIDDSVELENDKVEHDDIKKGKLAEFKSRAMQNRLASIWKDDTDLMGKVAIAIMKAKNEIKRPGWHRGNDDEREKLIKEITVLQKENETLRDKLHLVNVDGKNDDFDIMFREEKIELHYTERVLVFTSNTVINRITITTTLEELFKFVSLRLTGINKIHEFEETISAYRSGYHVNTQDALIVRNRFEQLGLIESFIGKDEIEKIRLTDFGKQMMNELNK